MQQLKESTDGRVIIHLSIILIGEQRSQMIMLVLRTVSQWVGVLQQASGMMTIVTLNITTSVRNLVVRWNFLFSIAVYYTCSYFKT